MSRPLHLIEGWRGMALRERDALLRFARDCLNRGDRAKAARHLAEARIAHRAALTGLGRRAA